MAGQLTFPSALAALRASRDRLAALLTGLDPQRAAAPSYATEWSMGQVASHLGSGAEIFGLFVAAGLAGTPAPGPDVMQPIWDRWNAKGPWEQVRDAVPADAGFVDTLSALTPEQVDAWQLDLFGRVVTLADLTRMRLAEHCVHTWDLAVMAEPGATLPLDAAELVIDTLPFLAGRAGKGGADVTVHVVTDAPTREFTLARTPDAVTLTPGAVNAGAGEAAATLRLPGEAFIRLVYGRLDPDHTPEGVQADGVELDSLRQTFPGV